MTLNIDKNLVDLKLQLRNVTDSVTKRWLTKSIYCLIKAIEHEKLIAKKAERKLKQEAKNQAEALKEALREIEKKRHRIK